MERSRDPAFPGHKRAHTRELSLAAAFVNSHTCIRSLQAGRHTVMRAFATLRKTGDNRPRLLSLPRHNSSVTGPQCPHPFFLRILSAEQHPGEDPHLSLPRAHPLRHPDHAVVLPKVLGARVMCAETRRGGGARSFCAARNCCLAKRAVLTSLTAVLTQCRVPHVHIFGRKRMSTHRKEKDKS